MNFNLSLGYDRTGYFARNDSVERNNGRFCNDIIIIFDLHYSQTKKRDQTTNEENASQMCRFYREILALFAGISSQDLILLQIHLSLYQSVFSYLQLGHSSNQILSFLNRGLRKRWRQGAFDQGVLRSIMEPTELLQSYSTSTIKCNASWSIPPSPPPMPSFP